MYISRVLHTYRETVEASEQSPAVLARQALVFDRQLSVSVRAVCSYHSRHPAARYSQRFGMLWLGFRCAYFYNSGVYLFAFSSTRELRLLQPSIPSKRLCIECITREGGNAERSQLTRLDSAGGSQNRCKPSPIRFLKSARDYSQCIRFLRQTLVVRRHMAFAVLPAS